MNRHQIRVKALQSLYQLLDKDTDDVSDESIKAAIQNAFSSEDKPLEDIPDYLLTLITGVLEHEATISDTISNHLDNWTIEQLNRIDRTILKIATYEILYVDESETPDIVAIDEAVELSKMFSDQNSFSFINGVLQSVANNAQKKR